MTIKDVAKKYNISQDTIRYYERVKIIPPVNRTSGGIRDFSENDLRWLELALCMRDADLPIEALIEYQALSQEGDSTIPDRLKLLQNQLEALIKQKKQIEHAIDKLNYKISRYEIAIKTGVLSWN